MERPPLSYLAGIYIQGAERRSRVMAEATISRPYTFPCYIRRFVPRLFNEEFTIARYRIWMYVFLSALFVGIVVPLESFATDLRDQIKRTFDGNIVFST